MRHAAAPRQCATRRAWSAFRGWPGIVQFGLLLAVLLVGVPALAGDLVLRNKETGTELRLLETPCSHGETLAALAPEWRPKFKNARILNAKGHIEAFACWIQHDADTVAVILEDGSMMGIASARFADPAI